MQKKLTLLAKKRHKQRRVDVETRNKLEGETISKYWSQINKEKRPRDIIYALATGNEGVGPKHETNSRRMAEIASKYHDDLQDAEPVRDHIERAAVTKKLLDRIQREPSPQQLEDLQKEVTESEVEYALKISQSGSAAGKDGATYDLWKVAHERYKEAEKTGKEAANIVKLITAAFNDIESPGVIKETNFSEGWMCPIYKKNERDLISNYRPITLLNTDYKLFTKTLSMKLARAAPTLIHESQAGFIPGRNITDQTKLTRMVMEYAEATEQNYDS